MKTDHPCHTLTIVLGNQLFPVEFFKPFKHNALFMAEDYGLCTHFKFHKHKLVLFLTAMRRFSEELRSKNFKIHYIKAGKTDFTKSYETKLNNYLKDHPEIKKIEMFEIEDRFFEKRLINIFHNLKLDFEFKSSPMFLTSRQDFQNYLSRHKNPLMKTFYEEQRKQLGYLMQKNGRPIGGKWSYDTENRKKPPKDFKSPALPLIPKNPIRNEVSRFVEETFKNHPGTTENFWMPTSRKEALDFLNRFIEERLNSFGPYQDALISGNDFLNHSILSTSINVGFLPPKEVCEKVVNYFEKNKKHASLASVEGFIRQVLGWREFVRGIDQNFGEKQWNSNFFGHYRRLTSHWYEGTTGIPILDDAIKKANRIAYNHHIERLMVLSNFMLLSEIHPQEVYRWFMEMNADSSDWVMGPNVFGMGQFSDGGIFATKPYICGSNYLLKMSHYKKGDWCDVADGLYWRFIDRHQDFFSKNPRLNMMVKLLGKIPKTRREKIFSSADRFLDQKTR